MTLRIRTGSSNRFRKDTFLTSCAVNLRIYKKAARIFLSIKKNTRIMNSRLFSRLFIRRNNARKAYRRYNSVSHLTECVIAFPTARGIDVGVSRYFFLCSDALIWFLITSFTNGQANKYANSRRSRLIVLIM